MPNDSGTAALNRPTPAKLPEVNLVHARGVTKRYGGVEVLTDATFDVEPGITGLLGANGAGKTTMLGMIIGLHHRNDGVLQVFDHDPWTAGPEVRTRLGYAPEHHTLPADVRAFDFVEHIAELHGLPSVEATTRASDALWLVGLGEERFRPMGTMSTGQRQRVKLAQAIAHDPKLIILDEPTDGLDPVQRDAMLDLIRTVSDSFGISVILSSHLLEEVEQICESVVIIGEGQTLASGRLDDLVSTDSIGVTIEIDGTDAEAAQLAQHLHQQGFTTQHVGRRLNVEGVDDRVFDVARDACVALNIGIVRLHRRRLSLEDVFLDRLG